MNITDSDPLQVVATAPPTLPDSLAIAILLDHWNIDGVLRPLVSDRDQNFRVDTPDDPYLRIVEKSERTAARFLIRVNQFTQA